MHKLFNKKYFINKPLFRSYNTISPNTLVQLKVVESLLQTTKLDTYCNYCYLYKSKDLYCCKCFELQNHLNIQDKFPICRKNYNHIVKTKQITVGDVCFKCIFDESKYERNNFDSGKLCSKIFGNLDTPCCKYFDKVGRTNE